MSKAERELGLLFFDEAIEVDTYYSFKCSPKKEVRHVVATAQGVRIYDTKNAHPGILTSSCHLALYICGSAKDGSKSWRGVVETISW